VVLDHSAVAGAPADVTDTLHRIEASTVRREVEAAGFKFEVRARFSRTPMIHARPRYSTPRSGPYGSIHSEVRKPKR